MDTRRSALGSIPVNPVRKAGTSKDGKNSNKAMRTPGTTSSTSASSDTREILQPSVPGSPPTALTTDGPTSDSTSDSNPSALSPHSLSLAKAGLLVSLKPFADVHPRRKNKQLPELESVAVFPHSAADQAAAAFSSADPAAAVMPQEQLATMENADVDDLLCEESLPDSVLALPKKIINYYHPNLSADEVTELVQEHSQLMDRLWAAEENCIANETKALLLKTSFERGLAISDQLVAENIRLAEACKSSTQAKNMAIELALLYRMYKLEEKLPVYKKRSRKRRLRCHASSGSSSSRRSHRSHTSPSSSQPPAIPLASPSPSPSPCLLSSPPSCASSSSSTSISTSSSSSSSVLDNGISDNHNGDVDDGGSRNSKRPCLDRVQPPQPPQQPPSPQPNPPTHSKPASPPFLQQPQQQQQQQRQRQQQLLELATPSPQTVSTDPPPHLSSTSAALPSAQGSEQTSPRTVPSTVPQQSTTPAELPSAPEQAKGGARPAQQTGQVTGEMFPRAQVAPLLLEEGEEQNSPDLASSTTAGAGACVDPGAGAGACVDPDMMPSSEQMSSLQPWTLQEAYEWQLNEMRQSLLWKQQRIDQLEHSSAQQHAWTDMLRSDYQQQLNHVVVQTRNHASRLQGHRSLWKRLVNGRTRTLVNQLNTGMVESVNHITALQQQLFDAQLRIETLEGQLQRKRGSQWQTDTLL